MLLTLLRHGEVAGRPLVFRGRSDPPLSARGWAQLERAARAFSTPRIDRVVSSPSRRCHEFAAAWAREQAVALIEKDALREIDLGDWEELSPDEARARDPECYEQLQRHPEQWCSPNGEPYDDFRVRVLDAIRELSGGGGEHVGVVTHAGVVRVVLSELLNIDAADTLRISIEPATACRVWWSTRSPGRLLGIHSEYPSWHAA